MDYTDGGKQRFINRDWRVDNFFFEERNGWRPKEAGEYVHDVHFDVDGDGRAETTRELPVYDLH